MIVSMMDECSALVVVIMDKYGRSGMRMFVLNLIVSMDFDDVCTEFDDVCTDL